MPLNTNIGKLYQLCSENPNLPVIPSVNHDILCDDTYERWIGSIGNVYIDEVLENFDDAIIYRSQNTIKGHYETFFEYDDDYDQEASFDAMKAKINALPWKRCIIVEINLPEFEIPRVDDYMSKSAQ